MRRAFFAPSFLQELEDILVQIEERFGETVRREIREELASTCSLICRFPATGKRDHHYPTALAGFVFRVNWIFFDYDDEQVRFLHIVDGRRDKTSIAF
jgi:plasmid stabilization system protein ParE